jgi:hypothetical protein
MIVRVCVDADHQGIGDFLVRRARRQQPQHLTLAVAQRLRGRGEGSVYVGRAGRRTRVEQAIEVVARHWWAAWSSSEACQQRRHRLAHIGKRADVALRLGQRQRATQRFPCGLISPKRMQRERPHRQRRDEPVYVAGGFRFVNQWIEDGERLLHAP